MTLHPVIISVRQEAPRRTPQQVQNQRRASRMALEHSAHLSGAPLSGWEKDASEAPRPNEGFHWSVSHTGEWAAAVVADRQVGIDVESVTPRDRELHDLVARAGEWDAMGDRSWPTFFRLWTAKEAVLKANGVGIGKLLECELARVLDENRMILTFHEGLWCVEHFRHAGHLAAVACSTVAAHWHVLEEVS